MDQPPAIIFPLIGKPCKILGIDVVGIYDQKGNCVISDLFYYRPAEHFDLNVDKKGKK